LLCRGGGVGGGGRVACVGGAVACAGDADADYGRAFPPPSRGRRSRRRLRKLRGNFNQIKKIKCQDPNLKWCLRSAAGRTRSASRCPPPDDSRKKFVCPESTCGSRATSR